MNSREPFGLAEAPTDPASAATAGQDAAAGWPRQDAQQHATPTAQGTAPSVVPGAVPKRVTA